jgi:DNA-binding Lrp family transcriptional regulator
MDAKDALIIEHLRADGRASLKELARKTGLRPSTIHQRIVKMVQERVIEKFTVKVNDAAVGEEFVAFLLIKGTTQKFLPARIINDPHVKEVYGVTGEYDLLIKLKFTSVKEFNEYLIAFRQEHPDIQSTLTMIGTAKLKEEL